jgi:hypothetical protein
MEWMRGMRWCERGNAAEPYDPRRTVAPDQATTPPRWTGAGRSRSRRSLPRPPHLSHMYSSRAIRIALRLHGRRGGIRPLVGRWVAGGGGGEDLGREPSDEVGGPARVLVVREQPLAVRAVDEAHAAWGPATPPPQKQRRRTSA